LRGQSFAEEFSQMGVGCRVGGRCRARLLLSGTKVDFVWAGSADKCTSCGRLFMVVYCSTCPLCWGYVPHTRPHARCFLGITHFFKVTRKRLKCLENAFSAISFSKFSGGGLAGRRSADFNPVLSGKHGRAPKSISPRTPTVYVDRRRVC